MFQRQKYAIGITEIRPKHSLQYINVFLTLVKKILRHYKDEICGDVYIFIRFSEVSCQLCSFLRVASKRVWKQGIFNVQIVIIP